MEASMSSMHLVSKFMLDKENCEKQWFYKQWDKRQHKINATHANFLASMDRKSNFNFFLCKEFCFVDGIQTKQHFF
jgi:hypothetical protein